MPQADPTKADRGTTAIIEIEGLLEPLRNIVQFSVSDDYLQVGDTFSAVVPDPKNVLRQKINPWAKYKFYLKNPGIDGGAPCLRQTGIIRGRDLVSGPGGDVINLRGADLGWHLTGCAPVFTRLEKATMLMLIQKLILENPAWGFAGTSTSNDLNRQLMQGRQGAQIQLSPSLITPWQVIQVEPGQQIIQVLQEYARRDGVFVNVSAGGLIQLTNPNYNQPVSFQVNYHPAGDPLSRTNNVIGEPTLEENADQIYNEVSCIWDVVVPEVGVPPFVANVGRHVATYYRQTNITQDVRADFGGEVQTAAVASQQAGGPPFPRRFTFADNEPMTPSQGARRAVWQAQRMEFDSFIYRCRLSGHSQNGKWLTSDTLASVSDSFRGIKGTLYCVSLRMDGDATGGNTTSVELRKTGLLSNVPLRQNIIENKNGVLVEVKSN
jgi:hypothetical protein